jgi:hypothetical protein
LHGDRTVARTAKTQEGVITRGDLRAAGLGRGAIAHRIAQGRLHRQHRATFLVGHEVPPERAPQFAAVLALGDKAYLSHGSALEDYGALEPNGGPIHVTVVGCCRRSRDGIRVHRTTRIAPEDMGTLDGLRITSPARAVLDYAEYATPRQLARVVNQLHVDGLATPEEICEVMKRTPGRRGAALLRATLLRHEGPARFRSGGERILLALFARARLPRPEVNALAEGEEIDLLYRDARLAIELDGGTPHGTPAAVDRDRRKDAHLRSRGYEVLRYSYWQIDEEPEAVVAEVARKLEERRAPDIRARD